MIYGPGDVFLSIAFDTNNVGDVDLFLHLGNHTNELWWELFSKDDLNPPTTLPNWTPIELMYNTSGTNLIWFTPIGTNALSGFFRAVGGNTVVGIAPDIYEHDPKEPCSSEGSPTVGKFDLSITPAVPYDMLVRYSISGSAANGVDYVTNSGSFLVASNTTSAVIEIVPLFDTIIEFSESVTFTLTINTNVTSGGYLIDPSKPAATMWISDCSNYLQVAAINLVSPAGIDYHPVQQKLLFGVNLDTNGETNNLAVLGTNGLVARWSGIHGMAEERKLLTVKSTNNNLGLVVGDVLFNTANAGELGWLSANGSVSNLSWCVLTNETDLLEGSIWIDQTGIFGNNLLAVSGFGFVVGGTRGLWSIPAKTNTVQLTRIPTFHLEGLLSLSNNAQFGPWAGKLLSADEDKGLIYAFDTNALATPFRLDIGVDKLLLIPTNQDVYCVFYDDSDHDSGKILKLSRDTLTSYVGDILAEQAGEVDSPPQFAAPKLFVNHWDSGIGNFSVRRINLPDCLSGVGHFEGITFAPVDIPAVAPCP